MIKHTCRRLTRLSIISILMVFILPIISSAKQAPDQLVVRLKPGKKLTELSKLNNEAGAKIKRNLENHRFYSFKLPKGADLDKAIEKFRKHPAVEYVGLNHQMHIALEPNDPMFRNYYSDNPPQWGLYNDGYNNDFLYFLFTPSIEGADIRAMDAWKITTGSNVIIASIDTGVDYLHEDLVDNIWNNPGEVAGNGIDDDNNGYIDDIMGWNFVDGNADVYDDHSHGTFTAGIAAAKGNNDIGIAGVAWNCKIMILKTLNSEGYGLEDDAARAVIYAVDNGAKVINMSLAGENAPLLEYAINYAWEKGALCVCASGNEDSGPDKPSYPASYANALAVGASNQADGRCTVMDWFGGGSNYGHYLDVVAPGNWIVSTAPNNTYDVQCGTSAAAPFVSGVAALIWSIHPTWTNAQVFNQIIHTADDVDAAGFDIYTGWGRVNALRALTETVSAYSRVGDVKKLASNSSVLLDNMVLSCSSGDFSDRLYVQDEDRASGVMLYFGEGNVPSGLKAGDRVNISGVMGSVSGECAIQNCIANKVIGGDSPKPLGMSNGMVGGGAFGLQGNVVDNYPIPRTYSSGMNNIGLLVTVFGKVIKSQDNWFYIDDGSKLKDNSGYTGIRVLYNPDNVAPPEEGSYAAVTGISSCELVIGSNTVRRRVIRPRVESDIRVLRPKVL